MNVKICSFTKIFQFSPFLPQSCGLFGLELSSKKIDRGGFVVRPPRSYDHTPLDFSLWSYPKYKVYVTKPTTREYMTTRMMIVSVNNSSHIREDMKIIDIVSNILIFSVNTLRK